MATALWRGWKTPAWAYSPPRPGNTPPWWLPTGAMCWPSRPMHSCMPPALLCSPGCAALQSGSGHRGVHPMNDQHMQHWEGLTPQNARSVSGWQMGAACLAITVISLALALQNVPGDLPRLLTAWRLDRAMSRAASPTRLFILPVVEGPDGVAVCTRLAQAQTSTCSQLSVLSDTCRPVEQC